jgi:hypothetical protein
MSTILVTSNADSGPNTLRNAINIANINPGNYTINIDPGITLISLTSGTLNITKKNGNLSIISLASTKTEISRATSSPIYFRIFTLNYTSNPGFQIYFENLKIAYGKFSKGCGIFASKCNIEINNYELFGNNADFTYDTSVTTDISCSAGAMIIEYDLIIRNSVITGNLCTIRNPNLPILGPIYYMNGGGLYISKSNVNIIKTSVT